MEKVPFKTGMKKWHYYLMVAIVFSISLSSLTAQTITTTESRCVNTGTVIISGTVGAGAPYQVSITSAPPEYVNPGAHLTAGLPDTIEALYPGAYSLQVVDKNGVPFNSPFTITGNYVLPGNSDYLPTTTAVTDCTTPNGSIQGTLSNGRPPYSYTIISGPAQVGTTNTTGTFTGLPAGNYQVQAGDSCQNIQTRSVTIAGPSTNIVLSNSKVNLTSCNNYSLTEMYINGTLVTGTLPAGYRAEVVYTNGATTVLVSGTSLPLDYSQSNGTGTGGAFANGYIKLNVYDACNNVGTTTIYTVENDWTFTETSVSYACTSGVQLTGVTTSGTIPGPFTTTVRPYYTNNNGVDIYYTAAQTVTSYPYTVTGVTTATNPIKLVTKITDACGVTKNQYDNLSFTMGGTNKFKNCTTNRINMDPTGEHTLPVTFTLSPNPTGLPSNNDGFFDNLPDGIYTVTAVDACGKTVTSSAITFDHKWKTKVTSFTGCTLDVVAHDVEIPKRSIGNVTAYQYQGGMPVTGSSTLLNSQTYSLGGNGDYTATINAGVASLFFSSQPNLTYSYVLIDSCGASDTISITNGPAVNEVVEHNARVVNKCINKGDIYASYHSNNASWKNVIVVIWNINTPGTLLHNRGYGSTSPERIMVTDVPLGRYIVRYSLEYCANVVVYDTVDVTPYVQPTVLTAQSFVPCAGGGTPVALTGANGVAPYMYEIINSNPNNYTAPQQAGNIFELPTTQSSVTARITDACLNSATKTVAIVKASPVIVRSSPTIVSACTFPLNFTLYTDSLYVGSVFEWTKLGVVETTQRPSSPFKGSAKISNRPSSPLTDPEILSNRPYLSLTYNSAADTGTYQVKITVPGTCFNVTATYSVVLAPCGCTPTTATVDTTICFDGSYIIAGHTYTTAGTYIDTLVNSIGCDSIVTSNVTINNNCSIYPTIIGDKVWRDDDKDGMQDAGEPGVAGVTVTLYNNTGGPIASTTTDAYGNYQFTNLATGDYQVQFSLPANYSFTSSSGTDINNATNSDANPVTGKTSTITITAGQTESDIDAGIIFTQPATGSSIGDYVWYDANGNGNQDSDEPGLGGVTVTLYDAVTGNVVAVTTTDASGHYTFNDVPNGAYQVGFTAPAGTVLATSSGTTTANNSTNSDADPITGKTSTITISSNGTMVSGIDAGIKDDPKSSIGDFVWNDVNHNGIQDAGEPGIAGVTIRLYSAGADGFASGGNGDDVFVAVVVTDATGHYQFNGLDPDKYFMTAIAPIGYTVTINDVGTDDNIDNDLRDSKFIPTSAVYNLLINQTYMGADFGMYNNTTGLGSIGDNVWIDTNGNGIQDAGEPAAPGITVSLLDGNGNPVNNPATGTPYVVVTDANGNYTFVDLPAGNYQIQFSNLPANTGFSPTGQGTTTTDNDANPATGITPTFTLNAGQTKNDVDAGIVPQTPAGEGSIGNSVWTDANNNGLQDNNEQGVPGVTVELYYDGNGDGLINGAEASAPVASTYSDAQGHYIFTGLDAGAYQVKFVTSSFIPGYTLQPGKNNVGTDDTKDSDADPATGLTPVFTLAKGEDNLTIDAGIYNPSATNSIGDKTWLDTDGDGIQDAGEPGIPGITVMLVNTSGTIISTVTDANGNYYFGNLPDGDYTIQVSTPAGFSITTKDAAGSTDTNDSDADPLTGATPVITLSGNTNISSVDIGFTTTRAATGDYVWYDADGDGVQDVTESGIAGVTVSIYRDGYGLDGIAGNGDDALPVASAITDANGHYMFSNLLPGDYHIEFTTAPSGLQFTQQNVAGDNGNNTNSDANVSGVTPMFTLSSGEIDMSIDAGLAPVLKGSVGDIVWFDTNTDGIHATTEVGVPGVLVTLLDNGGNAIGATITNGNGNYLLTNVTAGAGYSISFTHLPAAANFTIQNAAGSTSATNSDAHQATGITDIFTVTGGQKTSNIDAGIYAYTPLPIRGLAATATLNGSDVTVSWNINTESGILYYEVEQSTDNVNFSKMSGSRMSAVNDDKAHSYQTTDNITALNNANIIFYRVKAVGKDGKVSYSNVTLIRKETKETVLVFPNPFKKNITVSFTSLTNGIVETRLFDARGNLLQRNINKVVKGNNQFTLPNTSQYSKGVYLLEVSNNNVTRVIRLLKD